MLPTNTLKAGLEEVKIFVFGPAEGLLYEHAQVTVLEGVNHFFRGCYVDEAINRANTFLKNLGSRILS